MVIGSANAICGMITPSSEPSRPRFRSIRYSGRIATVEREQQPER